MIEVSGRTKCLSFRNSLLAPQSIVLRSVLERIDVWAEACRQVGSFGNKITLRWYECQGLFSFYSTANAFSSSGKRNEIHLGRWW